MIEKLTPEQEAELAVYADKWLTIGLSTEPANREEAERGARTLYEADKRRVPQCIWFESPEALYNHIYENYPSDTTSKHLFHRFAKQMTNMRADEFPKPLNRLVEQYFRSRHEIVWNGVIWQIWAEISHLTGQTMNNLTNFLYFAMEDYLINNYGYEPASKLIEGVKLISLNAGYWSPHKFVCLFAERPQVINLDNRLRLHSEDGLAIRYPDGWGVYAWHGVRVPEYIITRPHEITPDKIMSEQNTEISRVMLERYGQDNFIRDGGFTIQQSDDYGDLYRIEFDNGDEPIVAVHVQDASTDRDYFLYVPPHIRTAHQGVAWTFGYDNPADYQPDKET